MPRSGITEYWKIYLTDIEPLQRGADFLLQSQMDANLSASGQARLGHTETDLGDTEPVGKE